MLAWVRGLPGPAAVLSPLFAAAALQIAAALGFSRSRAQQLYTSP